MTVIIENYNYLVKKYSKLEKELNEKDIHDKRVILRKVFPILAAYKINRGKIKNAEKAFKLFGKLRDVQIQILKLEATELSPEVIDYYVYLNEQEQILKDDVRKFSKKKRLKFPEIKAKKEVDKAKIIRKAEKSLYKIIRKIRDWSIDDVEYIHQIRIEFKKFRYQVEVLANITSIAEERLNKIRLYQDLLGEIQDYAVLIDGITRYYKKRKQEEEISTDQFEENQFKLIDEFDLRIEDFIHACADVIQSDPVSDPSDTMKNPMAQPLLINNTPGELTLQSTSDKSPKKIVKST
ncbi:MAG: CHAD domain-containing protein [Paludibacter sp.]|nr:CHAD domain-containing protein [Paludibacter sp.]